ncbi:hypothetical protein C8A01DRAFT_50265 [Parachaetomium inaequale]|uniref:Uncharacterized protein n=1 Tax=Parachaetomium inaequale TaxID=2588326 RepID=A0AAN6SMU6_9PEZI|nr:hypothetical protein C8A01DRAFT_50265 [Parachaetomium inaequale]
MANTTCPSASIPAIESLPVPQNINLMIIPGTDTAARPMVPCCAPNPVQLVNDCWLWCEIPASYFNGTDKEGARQASSACLETNGRNLTGSRITAWQFNAAGRVGTGSVREIGLWVLAVSGLVYML